MLKNRNKYLLGLLVFFLVLGLVACNNSEKVAENSEKLDVISLEDDYSNIIQLDSGPIRIVSLSPSTTEILFALGLDEEIVGVTDYCDYPKEALEKDKVGGFEKANLERIISLGPDIVISSGNENREAGKILYDAGIQMASFNSKDTEAIFSEILRIGQIASREDEAQELVEELRARKEEVVKKAQGLDREKVFFEVWHDPLMTAGRGSYMDELISLAGGENIAGDIDNPYPEFSLESLIEKNPDVYLTTDGGVGKDPAAIKSRPGYRNIKAVVDGRVYILDANITSRPGPRIIDALELVFDAIHEE